jgi:geranylgeranyl diphosphate synthase type II
MDEAPLRRGKATVHEKWNDNLAILSGDVMMIKVYDFILEGNYQQLGKILATMNKVATEVCEGQQMDMNFETRDSVQVEEYIEMIKLKTSVLVGGALKLGALAADAPEDEANKLYDFGVNMGIAFQLMDDYLDAFGDPEKFGKQVGGDILANKKTYLSIRALEEDSSGEMSKWIKSNDKDISEKVEAVKSIYNANKIDQECMDLMNAYNDKALQSLQSANCGDDSKKLLGDFASWLMNRSH